MKERQCFFFQQRVTLRSFGNETYQDVPSNSNSRLEMILNKTLLNFVNKTIMIALITKGMQG